MSARVDALLSMLKSDILNAVGEPLLDYLQSVKADPSAISLAAQKMKLFGSLVAALPGLEAQVVQQLTGILVVQLQSLMTQAQTDANNAAAAAAVAPAPKAA